jgi:hypothetical protein
LNVNRTTASDAEVGSEVECTTAIATGICNLNIVASKVFKADPCRAY